ncbi:hypothetical protein M433DRAFT_60793 [Acidomyces richmondensis BFW]|nr:MAG: hypothetical protein FE78DRAFT_136427 [Acidomyces sp. 'richmondensis']KYG48570.1 hypothetical protein M433DRAFT_60793 [Acidomyces richmondensis BFW]
MPENPVFVVRPLNATGLDGAFRVHLPPEALEKLDLKINDLIRIDYHDRDNKTTHTGYGIAWRAADRSGNNPKQRPAKMTDILKAAYGFSDGGQATITKSGTRVLEADNVTLTDVTPLEYINPDDKSGDGKFFWKVGGLLIIGGILEQAKQLNKRLDLILSSSGRTETEPECPNRHIILHGYEGTGKSLLLERLAKTTACRTFNLQASTIAAGKMQNTLQSVFHDAKAHQPSLILIDDLEDMAAPEHKLSVATLARELDQLEGSRVLTVAATRSLTNIDSRLIAPGRFEKSIELPIPDCLARKQILNTLLKKPVHADDFLTRSISLKTHGFTGKDLKLLRNAAADIARERVAEEQKEWVNVAVEPGSHHPAEIESDPSAVQLTLDDFETALKDVRPTALREVFLEAPNVRWSDIGGSESIKQRFDEIIGWPIHHSELLKALKLEPPKGVLLYGPPGCSKTMTAQAVATTYDLNFIAIQGAELISMYVGESERAVREVFRKAKQASPCIIFFDEIDSIGTERDSSGTKGLNVLTTLLNEMDGFQAMKGVLVLAATNKPEVLDPALLRPGRFDSHVFVGLPNEQARMEILHLSLDKLPMRDVDFTRLVTDTEGYSGAEIVAICHTAKMRMARVMAAGADPKIELRAADFEEAIKQQRKGVTPEMLEGYKIFGKR